MELISRDEVIKAITGWETDPTDEELEQAIINLPTIEERKEGHWISRGDDQCSVCGMRFPDLYPLYNSAKYCPNCGAKMTEGEETIGLMRT